MKEDSEKYAAYLAQRAKSKKARRQLESRLGIKPEPPTDEQKAIRNEKARLSQANARASMTEAQRSAERARNRERMAKYRAEQRALKSNVEANRPTNSARNHMSNEKAPHDLDNRPAVGVPIERQVRPPADGGAAFPYKPERSQPAGDNLFLVTPGDEPGMSLRDYFAAKAMQMEMQSARHRYDNGEIEADEWRQVQAWVAHYAYEMADEMLRARAAVREA